jgi:tetratricopeptide (TPR) repeat protein
VTETRTRTALGRQIDLYDLPLTTSEAAAALFRDAQARLLRVQVGAAAPLQRAVAWDPQFAVAHATLALIGHDFGVGVDISMHVRLAQRWAFRATDRERSFVAVAVSRVHRTPDHLDLVLQHLAEHPRDALVLNLAAPTIAFAGSVEVPEQAWALVEAARPTFGTDWWYAGLLAFARQEQGHYAEAEELSVAALDREPGAGHAAHALAHAFYETGQHKNGVRWMDGWLRDNCRTTFEPSHYSWHAALHELALGDEAAVRSRYARELSPASVQGIRALVDSASLLWRARLDGSWRGTLPIEDVLSVVDERLLVSPPTPFVAMHVAVALAARGDSVGLRLLGRRAAADPRPAYRELVVPLASAMAALVEKQPERAAQILLRLMPEAERFGGSNAQREVIELTLLHALMESGNSRAAQLLIQQALDRPATSARLPAQRSRRASAS